MVEAHEDHQLIIAYCLWEKIPQALPIFSKTADEALLYLKQCTDDRKQFPHLVLLGSNLPQPSDFLLTELRKQHPHLPLIVLDTFENVEQVRQAYRLGANSVLLKPTTLPAWEALFQQIESFWFGIAAWPSLE